MFDIKRHLSFNSSYYIPLSTYVIWQNRQEKKKSQKMQTLQLYWHIVFFHSILIKKHKTNL